MTDTDSKLYEMEYDRFNRSDYDLEAFLIFSVCVAGKKAVVTDAKVRQFLDNIQGYSRYAEDWESPMAMIQNCNTSRSVTKELQKVKMGQYDRIARSLIHASELVKGGAINLRTCVPSDLEQIMGIGPKTARFFILHTQKGAEYAALDTHILRWLRDIGHDAPKSTPSAGMKYDILEQVFIQEAKNHSGDMSISDVDYHIWQHYSEGRSGVPFRS